MWVRRKAIRENIKGRAVTLAGPRPTEQRDHSPQRSPSQKVFQVAPQTVQSTPQTIEVLGFGDTGSSITSPISPTPKPITPNGKASRTITQEPRRKLARLDEGLSP